MDGKAVIKPSFDAYNAAYVQSLYDRYLQNPAAVDEAWRAWFETEEGTRGLLGAPSYNGAAAAATAPAETGGLTRAHLRAAFAAGELVDAYRLHGHRAAHVDPLGSEPVGHPMLDPAFHGTSEEELANVPTDLFGLEHAGDNMRDAMQWLRSVYCGPIGYEYEFLEDPTNREWLRDQIETGAHTASLGDKAERRLLERLTQVEAFEQFLHRSYLGQKRFSIEGNDMMVPMIDHAIEHAAGNGAREIVIGMAHRGRLNVLTHVLGMPYASILKKFEGHYDAGPGTGDVKYHLGFEGSIETAAGMVYGVLAPNPSHLEFVHAVVEGMTRAKQTDRTQRTITQDPDLVVPIVIHGDAAFSGQGVVPETLNLARLNGYKTGGTLHIIANNQVGFTTDPRDARSTDYASDIARGYDIPVFHVNADDPEACLAVINLAMAYRARFHSDVVIDLIGYRKYGHNEGDEPSYTQPVRYRQIAQHPTVRTIWGERLVTRGTLAESDVSDAWDQVYNGLIALQQQIRDSGAKEEEIELEMPETVAPAPIDTDVPASVIRAIDAQLHRWPDDFQLNPKLQRQLEKRAKAVPEEGNLDWAHGEALAFGSLLRDGVPIRLTGQDSERGTFSQRHLVLHDAETNRLYTPLANLDEGRASFEVYNSPLSELATMGFEYGFSVVAPKALVLWEAQFGDFVNGAQVIIDQFLAAGREKWGQESRLVLLLPHGYEGQGPEHSSARLERFLQLAAEGNIRVANCTTPAQYFHLLRRQAMLDDKRPLVVMTPKSLLRLPRAVSKPAELSAGGFHFVIDDDSVQDRSTVERVVACTGKVYYDLIAQREELASDAVAVVRIEQLYPFPAAQLREIVAAYPNVREIVWTQEEPMNMGAWRYIRPLLHDVAQGADVRYNGRPERASPAEGYVSTHEVMQRQIVQRALTVQRPRRAARKRAQA